MGVFALYRHRRSSVYQHSFRAEGIHQVWRSSVNRRKIEDLRYLKCKR
ncbi:MAG: hypothetical protein ACKESB_00375 [Candidatus Hodgkinia cicadicola]